MGIPSSRHTRGVIGFVLSWSAAPSAALADGCTKDTDCKGDRICVAATCVDPPGSATLAPPPPPPPSPPPAGGVRVTLTSNEPRAVLARVVGRGVAVASGPGGMATATSVTYDMACTVPCGRTLDRNFEYVVQNVSGFGGASSSFVLPDRTEVELRVESHSQSGYVLGFLGTAFGGAGLLTGGIFAGLGAAADMDGLMTAGLVTTLVSAPLFGFGLWGMIDNATDVTTERGEVLARTPPMGRGTSMTAPPLVTLSGRF